MLGAVVILDSLYLHNARLNDEIMYIYINLTINYL